MDTPHSTPQSESRQIDQLTMAVPESSDEKNASTAPQLAKESHIRSFVKGITWRILGTIDTMIISYVLTGNIKTAAAIGGTEVFTKVFLFYMHERGWQKVPPGSVRELFQKSSFLRWIFKMTSKKKIEK